MERYMNQEKMSFPTVEQLEAELEREIAGGRKKRNFKSGISIIAVTLAAVVLISNFIMPVLKIYGTSMTPNLSGGDIVAAVRAGEYERGDVIAFYYNNKVLVKRIIGLPGEEVDIDEYGNVTVDGRALEENYLISGSFGECDIELPLSVPEGRYFVMGDNRSVSSDSRMEEMKKFCRQLPAT